MLIDSRTNVPINVGDPVPPRLISSTRLPNGTALSLYKKFWCAIKYLIEFFHRFGVFLGPRLWGPDLIREVLRVTGDDQLDPLADSLRPVTQRVLDLLDIAPEPW